MQFPTFTSKLLITPNGDLLERSTKVNLRLRAYVASPIFLAMSLGIILTANHVSHRESENSTSDIVNGPTNFLGSCCSFSFFTPLDALIASSYSTLISSMDFMVLLRN